MKPARQVVTRSPHRTVGLINAGWVQSSSIEYESQLERHFVHLALLMPELVSIQHQPFKISYREFEKERTHIPDMLLALKGGRHAIVEIKPSRFVGKHKEKFDAASAVVAEKKGTYFVATEEHIDQDRYARAEYWLRYARIPMAEDICVPVMRVVMKSVGGVKYGDLLDSGISEAVILHLLGRRHLVADPDLIVGRETLLNVTKHGDVENEAVSISRWFGCLPWRAELPIGKTS